MIIFWLKKKLLSSIAIIILWNLSYGTKAISNAGQVLVKNIKKKSKDPIVFDYAI